MSSGDSFAGHIGGDDYVLVTPMDQIERAGRLLVEGFDALVPSFYHVEDRKRGFIPAVSRTGDEQAYPLMSISVAIVPCPAGRFSHPGEIAEVAGEIKHFLKQQPGSAWLVDRLGADIGLRCQTCGRHVLLDRRVLETRLAGFVTRGDPAMSAAVSPRPALEA